MNYLAHIYLSGNNEDIILGNFLGDYVKGNLQKLSQDSFPVGIVQGIALHRQIDSFTDTHPIVKQSLYRLQPHFHKFSGIVVDMFYDHIFAKNFQQYCPTPLPVFSQAFYQLLERRKEAIPPALDRMVISMTTRDWLTSYATTEGISWSLKGIASRLKFESGIQHAVSHLLTDYDLYEAEFKAFFPEIQQHCANFLAENALRTN